MGIMIIRFVFLALLTCISMHGYCTSIVQTGPTKYYEGNEAYIAPVKVTCSGFTATQSTVPTQNTIDCALQTFYPDGTSTGYGLDGYNGEDPTYIDVGDVVPERSGTMNAFLTPNHGGKPLDPDWYNSTRMCALWVQYDWANSPGQIRPVPGLSEVCVNPTPPDDAVVCTATSMTIDHGQIGPAAFNGSTKSGTGSVKCTNGDATVKIYLSSNTINFSNGGKSTLSFSGGGSSTIISAKENATETFTVTSKLSASGAVKVGDFSGSTSLITDIQ